MKQLLSILLLFTAFLCPAQDTVILEQCQTWARENHPLLEQQGLYKKLAGLARESNTANYLPSLQLNGQGTYQSDVTHVALSLPGVSIPTAAKDQYKMYVEVKQNIWDGGMTAARDAVEEAQEKANLQKVETELYQVRDQVNRYFFGSFFIQENQKIIQKKIETLASRETQLAAAVEHGMALQSDLDQLKAEVLKARQQLLELESGRQTLLSGLAILTGRSATQFENLQLPEEKTFHPEKEIVRPEMALFEKQIGQLDAASALIQKKRNPMVFGFGQLGYGRPGLNMLSNNFDNYYYLGIGVSWKITDWETTRRERESIAIQQDLVRTQQNQFERNMQLALDQQQREIAKINAMLEQDQQLIALYESIVKSSASKLENGSVTTADYLQDLNAEIAARIASQTHKIQLEQAKINYKNLQGKH